jgi:hypothetical protein
MGQRSSVALESLKGSRTSSTRNPKTYYGRVYGRVVGHMLIFCLGSGAYLSAWAALGKSGGLERPESVTALQRLCPWASTNTLISCTYIVVVVNWLWVSMLAFSSNFLTAKAEVARCGECLFKSRGAPPKISPFAQIK